MTTLLSCVGDTDPIRGFHDGAILHIARHLRPEKIILIHSEHSLPRHERVKKAIESIHSEYKPIIIKDSDIIYNEVVFLYDYMYSYMQKKIKFYQQNDQDIILNLTSGTPQMVASLFAVVQISDLNVKGYQVTTPLNSSNENLGHDNQEDIDDLIALNEDNQPNYISRIKLVKSENFKESLLTRSFRDLIEHNDFMGAFNLIENNDLKKSTSEIKAKLRPVIQSIKFQEMLPDVEKTTFNYKLKRLLNAYVLIDIQSERELVTESIIRIQNFAEAVAIYYLKQYKKDLIRERKFKSTKSTAFYIDSTKKTNKEIIGTINEEFKKRKGYRFDSGNYLSYPNLQVIIQALFADTAFNNYFQKLSENLESRNLLAHSLETITNNQINLNYMIKICEKLLLIIEPKMEKNLSIKNHIKERILKLVE